jgi:PmbA protein
MDEESMRELAAHALGAAKGAGASAARAFVTRSRDVTVEWRDGKLDRIRESTAQGLGVSLYVDGRFSSSGTSDLRPDAVAVFVEGMVAATRYLAADAHRHLPDPARYQGATKSDLQICDPAVANVAPEARLADARRLEEAVRAGDKDGRIISVTSAVSDTEARWIGVSTNGFDASERSTTFGRSVEVSVRDAGDRKPEGYAYGDACFAADLPAIDALGAEALRRADGQRGSKQAPTGVYEVVIENRVAPRFARHLFGALMGEDLQQKSSFLEGKLGARIGSDALTVTSDPHLPRGLATSAWDGEGMATARLPVFEKGVVKSYFLDTYYASKLGARPTTGEWNNLVWTPGERDAAAMIAGMKKGIVVTDFTGGNSNGTTGDFSLGIKGFYVERGAIAHPISEMNLAGNHLEFWKQLAEVGSDPWTSSSNRTPSLRFKKAQCSGT